MWRITKKSRGDDTFIPMSGWSYEIRPFIVPTDTMAYKVVIYRNGREMYSTYTQWRWTARRAARKAVRRAERAMDRQREVGCIVD